MKKSIIILVLVFQGLWGINTIADPPDPPSPPCPGSSPAGNSDPVGAPIDGGTGMLMLLCAGFGARKTYLISNRK